MTEQVMPVVGPDIVGDLQAPDDLSGLPGLSVTADPGPRACRLRLAGRLDSATVPLFTACLSGWVDRGMTHLVVDLTDITDVDSAGAAALSRAAHVITRGGGNVHVVATAQLLQGPLAGSGLDFLTPNDGDLTLRIGVRRVG